MSTLPRHLKFRAHRVKDHVDDCTERLFFCPCWPLSCPHVLLFLFFFSPLCSPLYLLLFFVSINHMAILQLFAFFCPERLSCLTSSNPFLSLRPTCQWFKDGVKLTEKSHQINNKERTLAFKSASPDDNGLYYCCAKNAAGHVCSNSNFTLNIIGVCGIAKANVELALALLVEL